MPAVCTNGVACFHGACAVNPASGIETCTCKDIYSGSQCSYRSGLLYMELPLAAIAVFVFAIMGLREAGTALSMLRFPESKRDFFVFPRGFKPTHRGPRSLQRYLGLWEGQSRKHITMEPHHPITRILIVYVVILELLPFLQLVATAFLPIVPWPSKSGAIRELFSLLLLQPLWAHLEAYEYPDLPFYAAVVAVPAVFLTGCVLGIKRFPLFKPQPKASPAESLSSVVLRAYSTWFVLPLMTILLMPLECYFVGYLREGSWIIAPVYDPQCFTWVGLAHAALGFASAVLYIFMACGVNLQLNCESSPPEPVLWTDARYMHIVHSVQSSIAVSVVAFGNSNPWALCVCSTLGGLVLLAVNLWMRPCIYSLINWLRAYGATLAVWTGVLGIVACIHDDPTKNSVHEIWSLGAIAISAVSFSSIFIQYLEEFWFMVSVLGSRRERDTDLVKSTQRTATQAASTLVVSKQGATKGDAPAKRHVLDFKPQLPPLHVLKKRSRRSIDQVHS